MKRKIAAITAAIILTATSLCGTVHAEETTVRADSGDFSTAIPVTMGNTINGSITETEDEQIYKFTLPQAGRITLNLTFYMKYCSLYIYGSDGSEIWKSQHHKWNENLRYSEITEEVDLINGTYYLKINGCGPSGYKYTGTYSVGTKFVSAQESFPEPNNDFAEAYTIQTDTTIKGQIAIDDPYDILKFSIFLAQCRKY